MLTYLRFLGIVDSDPRSSNIPFHETFFQNFTIIKYLKIEGFSDGDTPKLSTSCPKLFSCNLEPADIGPVFHFLAIDVDALTHESYELVLCCPELFVSDVDYCLRPTLAFAGSIGLKKLNSLTNIHAHLLNTCASKLKTKIKLLMTLHLHVKNQRRLVLGCLRYLVILRTI